jgi:hypothetical protein
MDLENNGGSLPLSECSFVKKVAPELLEAAAEVQSPKEECISDAPSHKLRLHLREWTKTCCSLISLLGSMRLESGKNHTFLWFSVILGSIIFHTLRALTVHAILDTFWIAIRNMVW